MRMEIAPDVTPVNQIRSGAGYSVHTERTCGAAHIGSEAATERSLRPREGLSPAEAGRPREHKDRTVTMNSADEAQYLVRTRDGLDYARVEPWEGGKPAAEDGARRIGGYVVALDKDLCVQHDETGAPVIVADHRANQTDDVVNALDNRHPGDDYAAATQRFAGPFCACGDYSCPATDSPAATCVNSDY